MAMSDDDRAAYAASVPVYVQATDETYEVRATSDGAVLATGTTARAALAEALDLESVGGDPVLRADGEPSGLVKKAAIRKDGDPDGAWRWLDATAVEDEPIGGARIAESTIWDLAHSLNASPKPVPINGGPSEDGYAQSEAHGDAKSGDSAHLANGWAHIGIPLVAKDGRLHLYLFAELVPSVAKEVDRGRLAFGSVYFGFETADENDNQAAIGAVLISHALTNDPAVATLGPGSERNQKRGALRVARSAWRQIMAKKTITDDMAATLRATVDDETKPIGERARAMVSLFAARGLIQDAAEKVGAAVGVTVADMQADPWALMDAVYDLAAGVRVEKRLEMNASPAPTPVAASKTLRAEGDAMPLGDEAEAFASQALPILAAIFGKPDATPDDLLAELDARKDELAAAMSEESETDGDEAPDDEAAATAEERAAKRAARAKAKVNLEALQTKVLRFEARDWLDAELTKRSKSLPTEKRDRWVSIAIKSGREVVEEMLDGLNAPPSGPHPFERARDTGPTPTSFSAAVDACMEDAKREVEASKPDAATLKHVVRAQAQKLAKARWPELVETAG